MFRESFAKNETISIFHTELNSEEIYYDNEDIKFRNDFVTGIVEIIGNGNETKTMNFKNDNDILLADAENISEDIEIIKFIVNNYNKNLNIFSNIKNFQKSRTINIQTKVWMSSAESITRINGDYTGYIIKMNNDVTYAVIMSNNTNYIFTFYNNYPFAGLTNFLSTIVFASWQLS